MGLLSIFGIGNKKIRKALRRGATIIDIRSPGEFDRGKIRSSFNIPIDRLDINLVRIRHMRKPIIVCANSEAEAEKMIGILRAKEIEELYNGGNWATLLRIIRSL